MSSDVLPPTGRIAYLFVQRQDALRGVACVWAVIRQFRARESVLIVDKRVVISASSRSWNGR